MNLTNEFKKKVVQELFAQRQNFGGTDTEYAKTKGIKPSIYSRLKTGETDKLMSDTVWITMARELQVKLYEDKWKVARTKVYNEIEDNLNFCKQFSKSMMLVDDCGIGKTFCTKHIIKTMPNAFYIDCSQAKTKQLLIRTLAKTVGIDNYGKYHEVKANLKYYLTTLEKPIVVLDEAGDLEYTAFLEIKEMWNGTDGACAWYMIGADGLRKKIERGISGKKVGYAEIFSRFSDQFIKLVPNGTQDKKLFYTELIGIVAMANTQENKVQTLVKKCINREATLRYLETLIKAGV